MFRLPTLFCALIFVITTTQASHAYIDPVSGSIIIQTLVGGLAAMAVAIKSVREKIQRTFASLFGKSTEEPDIK